MKLLKKLFLVIFFFANLGPGFAFNPANPYWMNLKPKLSKFLDKAVNKNEYKYEIIGPSKEMANFLGNRPDANVRFEQLVLDSPSPRKSLLAVAYDDTGKKIDSLMINLDVWVYRNVYMLKQGISGQDDITEGNFYLTRIPIRQMDEKLYFTDTLKQKVAVGNIAAGTPLKVNMIRHEKTVQIGDMIKIKSGSPFITLEFMCKAMSSGDVGDTINVYCQDMQNKNMKAELTGPGTAKLI